VLPATTRRPRAPQSTSPVRERAGAGSPGTRYGRSTTRSGRTSPPFVFGTVDPD
jgi:hypothetical protein